MIFNKALTKQISAIILAFLMLTASMLTNFVSAEELQDDNALEWDWETEVEIPDVDLGTEIEALNPTASENSDIWDGTVAASFPNGDGSESSPYLIYTAEQLAFLASSVNNGNNYSGKYIKLMANIDLNDMEWTPIGIGNADDEDFTTCSFAGNFDANFHTVSNLKIDSTDFNSVGFFGVVNNGSITSLAIINADVTASQSGVIHCGVIIGKAKNTSINYCYVNGVLSSAGTLSNMNALSSGLLVGHMDGSYIDNCYAIGSINATTDDIPNYAGGLVGRIARTASHISNSYFAGTIDITDSGDKEIVCAGGIVGLYASTTHYINNCVACGSITSQVTANSIGNARDASLSLSQSNNYYALSITASNKSTLGTSTNAYNFLSQSWIENNLGWDFVNVWEMAKLGEYPTLKGFNAANVEVPEIPETPVEPVFDATITVSNASAVAGQTFSVPVVISNNPGIVMMALTVDYDSSALELVGVTDGGILGTPMHSANFTADPYILCWSNPTISQDITANGTIATLNFKVKDGAAEGTYPITVSYDNDYYSIINVNFEAVDFNCVAGSVEVKDFVYGDIDGDEIVTNIDSAILSRHIAKWMGYEASNPLLNFDAADLDLDGSVTNKDVMIIARHLALWLGYEVLPKQ